MRRLCAALVTGALMTTTAAADEWPSRPVRMVNTFAAGGTADVLTRLVADHLTTEFKQQFFVETRAGAGGAIGVQSVANSPPDGYNFVLSNITQLVLLPISNPKLGYDPNRDLINIAYRRRRPDHDLRERGERRAHLRRLHRACEQVRGAVDLFVIRCRQLGPPGGQSWGQKAKIKVEHVPYKGAAQGIMDLVAGHIFFSAQTVSSTAAQMRGGALNAIVHSHTSPPARFPGCADLQGNGDRPHRHHLVHDLRAGEAAAEDIVQKMNREIIRAVSKPEVQQRLRQDGLVVETMSVEQLKQYIDAETARWRPVLEKAGLIGK